MRIRTVRFVYASDLFADHPVLWNELLSGMSFIWGSNSHSMVTVLAILEGLNRNGIDIPDSFNNLCDGLSMDTLVDLET